MAAVDQIVVRPARQEDVPYIRQFTTHTFDWGDYVADAISGWIDDEAQGRGSVYVAVVDGRPVAVTHVSYMSEDEAWFEGIRVHPDFRRMGIGRLLTVASIQGARRHGAKVCRAAIDGDNQKSMGLASSFGFRPVASIVQFELDVAESRGQCLPRPGALSVRTAVSGDSSVIYQAVSREMAYVGSDFYWSFVTPANVSRMVDAGKFQIAVASDSPATLTAGVAVSDVYVDSASEHPVVYGELASAFGDISGILALARDYAAGVAEQAAAKGLPTKLMLTCEKNCLAAGILRERGFKEQYIEGRLDEVRLWELLLDTVAED